MPMPRAPYHADVLALVREGLSPVEIAARLNLTPVKVRSSIALLRRGGELPPFQPKHKVRTLVYATGARIGRLADRLNEQDEAFQRWVLDNTPEGSSVADLAISALYDVFLDETQNQ